MAKELNDAKDIMEISYNTESDQEVKLSPNIIFRYFAKGEVTKQEAIMFMMLCKYQKLNPWLGDAWLVKYGSEPATLLTSYNVLIRKAQFNENYKMHKSGIIVSVEGNSKTEYRDGAFYNKDKETLLGGWCRLFIGDKEHFTTITLSEYEQKKKDGSLNKFWKDKPAMMIEKCAIAKIFRHYIQGLESMHLPEEMPQNDFNFEADTESEQPTKSKEAMQLLNTINCEPSLKIQIGKRINEFKNNDSQLDIIITQISNEKKLKSASFIIELDKELSQDLFKGEENGK